MKLETFFEKFDQFADAPDAVGKMRELILLLALDGKIGDTDAATWERVQLGDLGEWGSGGTPLSTESRYYDGNIPWLIIGDLNDGVVTSSMKTITEEGLANSSAQMLPKNVLLIAMYGSIGKLGITGIECATNQAIAFCKPDPDRADLWYLFYAFMGLRPKFLSRGQGLAQKNISQRILRAWEIGLPPLAEQKRIVAKVDELMALCDRLALQQQERETRHAALARASLARFADAPTPANLPFLFHPSYAIPPADLRKSILTLAVQGKLVPQDPNDDLPAIPSDGQTVGDSEWVSRLQLPDTWLWARFESLLGVLKNGFNGKPSKVVGKFKVTRIETIARETIDLARVGFADDLPGDVVAKHAVLKGDILFSHINSEPHLGKTAICTIDDPTLVHGVNLLLLRPIAGVDSAYLNITLRELRAAGYFVSIAQRAVNQASINQKNLGKTPIPLPPLAEQGRIVAKVEQLMAWVDALETQLAASRATAANLLSALVAELTGTPHNGKVSVPSASTTGRRGRPRKSV